MASVHEETARAARFSKHARRYSELGWALIPLDGKTPRPRRWETTKPEEPELVAGKWNAWGERWNLGGVLGTSELEVVEYDTEQGRAKLLELLGGKLPAVPVVRTGGRGLHLYFRATGHEPASRDGLELRAGRQQCVLPPSVPCSR